jgi:ADP-dependent NAD(P)H-hydrate dehydratase
MSNGVPMVESVPRLPVRPEESHKGTYGKVLVIAGSRGMSGAAVLCGSAALRGGAGLVQVACPNEVQPTVAHGNPCYTTHGIHQHANGTFSNTSLEETLELAKAATVLAIGPGLGNRPDVAGFVLGVLDAVTERPIVVDADGLNVLPLEPGTLAERSGSLVMTPHPGEFARLTGLSRDEVQSNRQEHAVEFARKWNAVLVLKGHRTVVTDGQRMYLNTTGNPGMATGGTGDVLTGLLAALIAQGMPAFDAACLAVRVHGRAGDIAAERVGQVSLIASDLLDAIPLALKEHGE